MRAKAPPTGAGRSTRAAAALLLLLTLTGAAAAEREPLAAPVEAEEGAFATLFDAVVERTEKSFWDPQRLAAEHFRARARELRPSIAAAGSLEEAAERINALLKELNTSHTALVTPANVDYYVLLDVFSGKPRVKQFIDERFWGAGVTYAGIGTFTTRLEGRDFVEQVLEGSPAERAGLRAGDEIVSVDGAPYQEIASFRGKIGRTARVLVRESADGVARAVEVDVVSVAPLYAFGRATLASARVIERDGRRIGYVHVWASVGDASTKALAGALEKLGAAGEAAGEGARGRDGEREHGRRARRHPLDGLVLDMRGRIGGTATSAAAYLDLIDPRGPLLASRSRPRVASLRGRSVLLIDHHTRSTAELFVHSYRREHQGLLFGTRTAGAVSAASAFVMPGGSLLYLAVAGLEVDGDVIEGHGIEPDRQIARPLPYAHGGDPALDGALEYLLAPGSTPALEAPARGTLP